MAPSVQAQTAQEQAKTHYEAGIKAAIASDYVDAIYQFKQGHKLAPNGLFTYNITIAHIRLGNPREALTYARETSTSFASDLDETQTLRNGARLRALLLHQTATAIATESSEATLVAKNTTDTADTADTTQATTNTPEKPNNTGLDVSTPVADIKLKKMAPNFRPRLVGGALIGSGLVIAVAGSAFGLSAQNRWQQTFERDYEPFLDIDPEAQREDATDYSVFDCDTMTEADGMTRASTQDIENCKASLRRSALYGGLGKGAILFGGGMAAAGILLLVTNPRSKQRANRVQFTPLLSPTTAGMGLHLRF